MRRARLVALVLIVLAGCAREGRPSDRIPAATDRTAAPAMRTEDGNDRAAFVRAVNEACRHYADRDEALEFPEELDDYVPFMRAFIANSADLDKKLSALRPPAGIEGFDDYVAGNRRQTDILRAALPTVEAAVRDSDLADADVVIEDAIDAFNGVVDELDPYAVRYGFTDCASDPET